MLGYIWSDITRLSCLACLKDSTSKLAKPGLTGVYFYKSTGNNVKEEIPTGDQINKHTLPRFGTLQTEGQQLFWYKSLT